MPLLHRKAFVRQKPPADLRPDEEVFLCKITHEVFRTYDEFFERTILCNSLVWSCALTGRASLTYLEALESEQRARQNLQSFPRALLVPLLHLAARSRRCRLMELCEDVYAFAKDRFFPGEVVDVSRRNGTRQVCEILQVMAPPSGAGPVSNGHPSRADGDTIVISDSDDEQGAAVPVNGKKKRLSPSAFRYRVRMKEAHSEPLTVRADQISRRKSTLSRERLKLLLKHTCEPRGGVICLKPSTVRRYRLHEQSFSQFFPDEPPLFPFSPSSNGGGRGSPGQLRPLPLEAVKEKLKLLQKKEEVAAAAQDRARLRREKEEVQEARRRGREDKDKLREEQRRRFEEERQRKREEKERQKLEKEREREKLKEEKKKYAQRLKQWNLPREDMECDDLKELPPAAPVQTRLPDQLFGEALMVLEFLRAFGAAFDLKDEFPDGLSMEVLEEALVGSDPEGPLCELLFFFLTAIFQALDEEQEEVAREQAGGLWEAPDDDPDPTRSALSAVASLAAAWPPLHQGCTLTHLDLDSCTLSEILRLHILACGADCNHGNAKFRYQKRGGFTLMDDPCVALRLTEPALLKRLARTPVYDLAPEEKMKILQALLGKLLTLASSRDLIEDAAEEQRAARQELRELRAEQHRRGREEAALRVRLRKEEKLREQEQRRKEKEAKLRVVSRESSAEPPPGAEEQSCGASTSKTAERQPAGPPPGPPLGLTAEEQEEEQQKVRDLQQRIRRASACTGLPPLGRDRLYRRYWLLPSAAALLVEDDRFGLTPDMLRLAQDAGPGEPPAGPAPIRWFCYRSPQEVEQLIGALNPRGHREGALREALLQEPEWLQLRRSDRAGGVEPARTGPGGAEALMEDRLRDLLLDLEDRVHQGTLGSLKVMDRQAWRSALEAGTYELLGCDGQVEAEPAHLPARDRLQELRPPQVVSGAVRVLAQALGHVEQGIERRFLRPPLGDEESKKDQRMKKSKKKDEEQASDDGGSDSGRVVKTVLERWRESLLSCSSLSQVFVHLSSLERSILWSRSVLNARCRVCRRKGDADNMLLCDGCDRGHHTHCLRPRLKSVPEGNWFCPDCRPKKRSNRVPSRQRSSIEDEDEDEEETEEEEEESEESEEEESEEEEELVVSTKKSQAPPPKGRSLQATPKNNTASSGKNSKSSGKKTPPTSKGTAATQGRAPPRSGSRSGARQHHETSPGQSEVCKRPAADSAPTKPPRTVLPLPPPPTSSSRRSSGRSQGVHELSACEQLVVLLVRHEDSWPFMKLVSRTQVPDYYDIIRAPIALSTIREKVNNCQYQSAGAFISDVELMFSNCLRYNPRHTSEAKAGLRLQLFFHAQLRRLGLSERSPAPPAKRSRQ